MIWLQPAWKEFCQQWQQGTLAPVQMVIARIGCGGEEYGWKAAGLILCQHSGLDNACGQCQSCRLLQDDSHPDCYFLDQDSLKVTIVREVIDKISRSAQIGQRKVILIHDADKLTISAANCLLKTLEETPANTYFIMQTCHPNKILPTVFSRCHPHRLPSPTAAEALTWLSNQSDIGHDGEALLAVFEGAPIAARDSAGWPFFLEMKQVLIGLIGNTMKVSQCVDKYEKEDLDQFFIGLFHWLKHFATHSEVDFTLAEFDTFWQFCMNKRQKLREVATLNKRLLIESIMIEMTNLRNK